jgi:hypothetical protein
MKRVPHVMMLAKKGSFPLAPRSGERVPERSEGGRGARAAKSALSRLALRARHPLPQAQGYRI